MQNDSIIILAWPKTPAKAIGMWYDKVTKLFGFLKKGYYMAGHAAAVLVNHSTKELRYFDFGRYHMPQKYGRIRDIESDPKLEIKTKLILTKDNFIENLEDILFELSENKECKGKGILYASVLEDISYDRAFFYAKNMQNRDAVYYGPYDSRGTNCSRFICSIAKAGNPGLYKKVRFSSSVLLTPLTKANVFAANKYYYLIENLQITKRNLTLIDQLQNYMFPFFINLKLNITHSKANIQLLKKLYVINRK